MTQLTQEKEIKYDPSKLKAYLELNPDTKNDILYSLCGAVTDSEKGYIRKKKSRLLEGLERSESSDNKPDSEVYKGYTKKKVKDIFHDIPNDNGLKHIYTNFFDQLASYPLPFFIYSKVLYKVRKEFGYDPDSTSNVYPYPFSFYNACMNIIANICNGELDDDIFEFFMNIEQSVGDVWCKEIYNIEYTKEAIENYGTPGSVDYEEEKEYILEEIEHTKQAINELVDFVDKITFTDFKVLRSKILYYIFFEYYEGSYLRFRSPEIVKDDVRKIVFEYNVYNEDKKNFIEEISYINGDHISYNRDKGIIEITEDAYIDLGTHGKEFLGIHEFTRKINEEWVTEEFFFDTVKFE